MNQRGLLLVMALCAVLGASAQREDKFPVASAQLDFVLPTALNNTQMRNLTEVIGQLGLTAQFPLFKGLGIGAGARATFFDYDVRSFGGTPRTGGVQRWSFFGKLQYEALTSEKTFVELAVRAGQTRYGFNTDSCPTVRESGLYLNPTFAFYVMATKNLAFGIMLGYESDNVYLKPEQFCLEALPNHRVGETEGPIQYFTLGLSVSSRFRKGEEPMDYYMDQ
ncbi:MAG: hypothetical protein WAU70_11885 [Flavobacteriales bacterium]